jgi:hypothetical protein
MLLALEKNHQETPDVPMGKLHTVSYADRDYTSTNGFFMYTQDNWQERWGQNWELTEGDSLEKLPPLLEQLGSIDMFVHDSKHTLGHMIAEYEMAYNYLPENGILASDDAQIGVPVTKPFEFFNQKLRLPYMIDRNFGFAFKKTQAPTSSNLPQS